MPSAGQSVVSRPFVADLFYVSSVVPSRVDEDAFAPCSAAAAAKAAAVAAANSVVAMIGSSV